MGPEDEAVSASEVLLELDCGVAVFVEEGLEGFAVGDACFQGEGGRECFGLGDEFSDEIEAVRASVEGELGFESEFWFEGFHLCVGQVGEICDDPIGRCRDAFEKISLTPCDGEVGVTLMVSLGERESGGAGVEAGYLKAFDCVSQTEGQGTGASAYVVELAGGLGGKALTETLHKKLRFGTGDEGLRCCFKDEIGEFYGAEKMLERLAMRAAFDEGADLIALGCSERPVELKVELEAWQVEDVSNDKLGLQLRRGNLIFFKERGGGVKDFEERHGRAGQRS